ncbi:MAG: hypothetical protein HY926_10050 [Elusimicrobia bacterium]|nr:hypothetical protein [Elusimicrobiota bacterium]
MHDERHEERCLLDGSGIEGCAECRAFLAAMEAASDSARRAALEPPAWLDAQVLGGRASRPRWSWVGASLAAACAAAALVVIPTLRVPPNLSWTNGIEKDLARMDKELADISKQVAVDSEAIEFYQDLDRIERMAQSLKQQKL